MAVRGFLARLVPAIDWLPGLRPPVAAARPRRRPDDGRRDPAEGDGVRGARGPARAGRPLHGPGSGRGVRRAGHVPPAEREYHDDDRHPDGGRDRVGRAGRQRGTGDGWWRPRWPSWSACVLVLASALRLGFLANFISDPVLTGFKAGVGVVIVVDQVPKLLGIHFQKGGFFENVLLDRSAQPGDIVRHAGGRGRHARGDGPAAEARAAHAGAAGGRGRRHRRIGPDGARRLRRGSGRRDSSRAARAWPCPTSRCSPGCGRRPWASR